VIGIEKHRHVLLLLEGRDIGEEEDAVCSPHLWELSAGGERGCEAEPAPSALGTVQRCCAQAVEAEVSLTLDWVLKEPFPMGARVEFTRQVFSCFY